MNTQEILNNIPLSDVKSISPFNKGWSNDEKYIITQKTGQKFLLRIGPHKKLKQFENHFNLLKYCNENEVPTHQVISFGECLDNQHVYILMEWLEADDLETSIQQLAESEQYDLGVQAGHYLQQIHRYPYYEAPEHSWEVRFNQKIDRKIEVYSNCPYQYENDEVLLDTIKKRRHLLKDTEVVQHHGDYHIGNMMIDKNHRLYIIDFDRHDVGEPFEEFNRIVWCKDASPHFASGRINGYFNNDVPEHFWGLLQLYISSNTLSSLPWAVPFGEKEMTTMRTQFKNLLDDYDHVTRVIPKWYQPPGI